MAKSPFPCVKLSSEQQKDLSREILAAEARIADLLAAFPEALAVLNKGGVRPERTRAGWVDRLGKAVEAAERGADDAPASREIVRECRRLWDRSVHQRWTLAMSALKVARGEARALAGPLLEEEDLLQEGMIGLLNAAKRFDPERGILFDTYARWWARAQITRAIEKGGRTVRIPSCAVEQMRNLRRAREDQEMGGRGASVASLAADVGIRERRARMLLSQGATISLEQPVDFNKNPRTLGQTLVDEDATPPDNELILEDQLAKLNSAFDLVLNDRDQLILMRRFGLDRSEPRTLTQVGHEIGLSRERVRQLEKAALARLGRASGVLRNSPLPLPQQALYRRSRSQRA